MKYIQLALARPVAVPRPLNEALGITAFALMTALAAFVRVPLPFTPVPMTLQTLAVLCSAGFLGRKAAASQALYLAVGAAGLPVFNGAAGGFGHLLGPTGGYLSGFVAAAFIVGWMLEGRRGMAATIGAMVLGSLLILAAGSAWLSAILKLDFHRSLQMGFLPFLAGDLAKAGMAALAAWGCKRRQSY
jgi:biotin transport system substrate-specific component